VPSVLDLRRRIRSVKNTQQITRAMKMVAAARLRRAQTRVLNARPYAEQMRQLLTRVAARIAAAEGGDEPLNPLFAKRPVKRILLVVITADRGLAGAFNANVIRAAQHYLSQHREEEISLACVGRKGRDFFRKHQAAIKAEYMNIFNRLEFSHAQEISRLIMELYSNESVDAVDFIHNEFKSMLAQRLMVERYLPFEPAQAPEEALIDYIYEQPPREILNALLPRYFETLVYRALLESQAAELAAKMTAMDTATNNAADLINSLTLYLNRVRQATITKEIIEIVSGAAAQ
jgi:F-type H+-transporting ATPase subunit gamma